MENAFEKVKTVNFDHLLHRSPSYEDLEDIQSQILRRHESFTFDILESLEAKVIIVYGVKVQKRLLESRMLTFFPPWDEYDGVFVALDRICNYREPDEDFKFRRALPFHKHSNYLMYLQKGSKILIWQDVIVKAAADMVGAGYLVRPNFYRDKLGAGKIRSVPPLSKKCTISPNSWRRSRSVELFNHRLSRPRPIRPLQLYGIISGTTCQPTVLNKVRAEEILLAALAVWCINGGNEQRFNWRNLSHLPLLVLKWL